MEFAKRMSRMDTGIFATLAKIKAERLAKGLHVVDFSVGAPNIPPSQKIIDTILKAAEKPENYVYGMRDRQELREAVAKWYHDRYNVTLNPDNEIISLQGSQEGFVNISQALVNEGDIVLVPSPCYPAFADGPRLAGGVIYYMPMTEENDFLIDFDAIPEDVAQKAKLIIINYPNNPTTATATPGFYRELIAFAKKYDICVLHDNAYSDLVFDGVYGPSFLEFEGAREVGVEFNSLSKTYGLAGARIGFCVGNREVVDKMAKLKSNTDYGMFIPFQLAAAEAITGDQTCVIETREAYEKRRDFLCAGLNSIGWKVKTSPATMFVWARIPDKFRDSEEFCMELITKAGVIVTPGGSFGKEGDRYVRIALVRTEEEMQTAIDAIRASGIID